MQRDLVWTGANHGRAYRQDPLPLAFTRICAFKKPAIAALDAAGLPWTNAVDSGNNAYAAAIACTADLGVRADLRGFKAPGMAEINDAEHQLPKLPTYFVNLRVSERAGAGNDNVIQELARLIRTAFTAEVEKDRENAI